MRPFPVPDKSALDTFLADLEALFKEMDAAYDTVSRQYGFLCQGCTDNCCETRFYHHTLLEYLYLKAGMRTLPPQVQDEVLERACQVNRKMADAADESVRILCPLNQGSRCRLYGYRPMICRLHGIAHELRRPDGKILHQPGCDAFLNHCQKLGKTDYIPFDRTPFYRKMAALEQALRQQSQYREKIRMTISQILVCP
ncbi:hypothetical protein LJC71_11110 [Desulfosarcina sp. OttesenSCG-928-A07]|nr:hypothetical protein [Desulfosarcina sp. OttesenSCG-928-G17]MDL2330268.1 hypothetical protein [Desulfosarcina sp. OttesenSCG-928-A07]